MSLRDFLRKRTILVVLTILVLLSAGLYARLRYVNKKLVVAQTARIRLAAELDEAVAEAKQVRQISSDRGRGVVEAGASVTARVAARVERTSEAEGGATVEVFRQGPENVDQQVSGSSVSGRLTLTDDHARFEASADYSYRLCPTEPTREGLRPSDSVFGPPQDRTDAGLRPSATTGHSLYGTDATVGGGLSGLRIGPVSWTIHQVFTIETIQFSQRVEGETLWQGYSVTLHEVSPVTGETLETWTVPHDQIDASYVPTTRLRRWAMFTEAGFTWETVNDNPGFYGAVGVRYKRLEGAVGLTDEDAVVRFGWRREW